MIRLEIAGDTFDFPIAIACRVVATAPTNFFGHSRLARDCLCPARFSFRQGALGGRRQDAGRAFLASFLACLGNNLIGHGNLVRYIEFLLGAAHHIEGSPDSFDPVEAAFEIREFDG